MVNAAGAKSSPYSLRPDLSKMLKMNLRLVKGGRLRVLASETRQWFENVSYMNMYHYNLGTQCYFVSIFVIYEFTGCFPFYKERQLGNWNERRKEQRKEVND